MASLRKATSWQDGIQSILDVLTTNKLVLILQNVLNVWDLVDEVRERIGYHGMYEILDYDATLELKDPDGHEAVLTRHEVIQFLQDNIVAIHDHAWGDGELFAEYNCQPGIPVDFYEDGSKWNVLISLRETKNRGDVINLWIERVIRDGFLAQDEWLETTVDHAMKRLKLTIIFPKERRCQRATITQQNVSKTATLGQQHFEFLGDGRQKLTWKTERPRLHETYTIKWRW